ncbi:MAG: carbon storage regulator [Planctomycetes bacterium RBG_13_63_9]|nr:MAG: carbon storage regulator [Planctomycetes bacterium RBG_13_63_9]
MLVLSRQRDESIVIGDDIIVTIVDIRGDKVRLGIDAPVEIPVHRQEVYDAIRQENRGASPAPPKAPLTRKDPAPPEGPCAAEERG